MAAHDNIDILVVGSGQNRPSTFSMCMITKAMHAVVIESELYISYVNFKTLHAAGNAE